MPHHPQAAARSRPAAGVSHHPLEAVRSPHPMVALRHPRTALSRRGAAFPPGMVTAHTRLGLVGQCRRKTGRLERRPTNCGRDQCGRRKPRQSPFHKLPGLSSQGRSRSHGLQGNSAGRHRRGLLVLGRRIHRTPHTHSHCSNPRFRSSPCTDCIRQTQLGPPDMSERPCINPGSPL